DDVRAEREAAIELERAFRDLGFKDDVASYVKDRAPLGDAARRAALDWLPRISDDPSWLSESAWKLVATTPTPDECRRALRLAETARRMRPDDGIILNTLGVAQYRAGKYGEAVETLRRSGEVRNHQPADMIFLAMALHRLGRAEEARATLTRIREMMTQSRRTVDAETKRFLAEAEALIDPPAAP